MTNEPNSIGLANIQRPEPARFAESDTDSDGVRWDEGQELSVDQRTELNGIYHYKQNGKSKYGIWHPTGFYCKLHIWDAIYQDGELSRYRRWERKYFDAIQKFLDRENKKVVADANSN